jgi:hypothetical protein
MTKYKLQSRSLADARSFFERIQGRVSRIRTKTNKISPHLIVTFYSDLDLKDLKGILAEMPDGQRMLETLKLDQRRVLLI